MADLGIWAEDLSLAGLLEELTTMEQDFHGHRDSDILVLSVCTGLILSPVTRTVFSLSWAKIKDLDWNS